MQQVEQDIPGRFAEPRPIITELLTTCATETEVYDRLSDIAAPQSPNPAHAG